MTKQKTVVLFGGAFDPPHNGHVHMARAATEQLKPDSLLWIPTAHPAHRAPAQATFAQRCDMIGAVIADQPRWQLCTIENERDELSYFFHTLDLLIEKEGPAKFYVLIGQDQLETFSEWDEWEHIVEHATLVVMPREACTTTTLPDNHKVMTLTADKKDISSTQIRSDSHIIEKQETPSCIKKYIVQNALYQNNAS